MSQTRQSEHIYLYCAQAQCANLYKEVKVALFHKMSLHSKYKVALTMSTLLHEKVLRNVLKYYDALLLLSYFTSLPAFEFQLIAVFICFMYCICPLLYTN